MNKYRQAMIVKKNTSDEEPFICTRCAGWSSFGNKSTPMYIALYGDICICTPHWIELQKLIQQNQVLMLGSELKCT
jgi:hypothetical protein